MATWPPLLKQNRARQLQDATRRRALGAREPWAPGAEGVERGGGGGGRMGVSGEWRAVRPPFLGGEARVPGSPRALL